MQVRELLDRKVAAVVKVGRREPVAEAIRLLLEHQVGGLPVVDERGDLCGFIAERDIVRAAHDAAGTFRDQPVERLMRRPAPTCSASEELQHVMARLTRDRLRHLVVMDGNRIAGVLSVGDIVKHRLEQLETETGVLRDYVLAQRAR